MSYEVCVTTHPTLYDIPWILLSHPLYLWHHTPYMWHKIHCIWHNIHYTWDIPVTLSVPSPNVLITSQPLYMTLHLHTYDIICTIHDVTPSFYDFKLPVFMTSHPLYLWHLNHYLSHQIYSIQQHHIRYTCNITATVLKTSNWLYVWSQPNMCVTSYSLYDITHSLWHQVMSHTLRDTHWERRQTLTERDTHRMSDTHIQRNTYTLRDINTPVNLTMDSPRGNDTL